MTNYGSIDILLGEALERLNEAAREIKSVVKPRPMEADLRDIGRVIAQIWQVRERLYEVSPESKPDFLKAMETDKAGYDELSTLLAQAHEAERAGNLAFASDLFKSILVKSKFKHFDRCAQAGLYRISVSRLG